MVLWNSQGPTGRERAIESLIDREPHGNYYRAARVVDEAVPAALGSRPNLVTKTALVEQAFALSVHDVDTVEKYDAEMEAVSEASASASAAIADDSVAAATNFTTPAKSASASAIATTQTLTFSTGMDAATRERVLRHQDKLGTAATAMGSTNTLEKSNTNATTLVTATTSAANNNNNSNSARTPPPALVAALRQVYDSDPKKSSSGGNSHVRMLLERVTNHAVFGGTESPKITTTTGAASTEAQAGIAGSTSSSSTQEQSGPLSDATGPTWQANLESLIANLAKMNHDMDQNSSSNSNSSADDDDKLLQGLLIAVMGVLTGGDQQEATEDDDQKQKQMRNLTKRSNKAQQRTEYTADSEPDDPVQPFMQVASALSLLPCGSSDGDGDSTGSDTDTTATTTPFDLDASLLQYFGRAAAVYEERLDIQKARLLARLMAQAPTLSTPVTVAAATPAEATAETPVPEDPDRTTTRSSPESSPPALIRRTRSNDEDDEDNDEDADSSSHDEDDDEDMPGLRTSHVSGPHQPELEATAITASGGDDSDNHAALAEAHIVASTISASEAAEAALNAAFEQIIASGNLDAEDEDEDIEQDSSSSDSEEDTDGDMAYREHVNEDPGAEEEPQPNEDGNEDSSESSSSSSSGGNPMLESERGLDTDDEDDPVMRQALAMSMARLGENVAAPVVLETPGPNAVDSVRVIVGEGLAEPQGRATPTGSTSPSMENPVSTTNSQEDDDGPLDAGVDESSLPPLPRPPAAYPFASLVGMEASTLADGDADAVPLEKGLASYFDPSAFSQFGSLPTSHVLVHLMKYTTMLVERRRFGKPTVEQEESSSVPGGMGSSLFATPRRDKGGAGRSSSSTSKAVNGSSDEVTLQLLVASFLLMVNKRHDAIENLRKALSREQRVVQGDDFETEGNVDENDTGMPLSEEEDDPALTLAMNCVEDDLPLSSDSLENKGMRRKAAAAAHDAAALLKSLRKRTDAWKDRVRLYSHCALTAAKSLRQFLQFIVRRWLRAKVDVKGSCISAADCHKFLPPLVASNLTDALASLTSVTTHTSFVAMLGGDLLETQELFMSLRLYQEAIGTWAECVPVVYPSESTQSDTLRSLMKDCSSPKFQGLVPSSPSIGSLSAFPSSDLDQQIYRLQALCRRLRVSDLLDAFVSGPAVYFPDSDSASLEVDEGDFAKIRLDTGEPRRPSSLIVTIAKSLSSIVGARGEAQSLYLALCHRCHARMILLDGLYATTETETEEATSSSIASKSLSTGDTVQVSASPSSDLQFDTMKCSDSIAVLAGTGDSPSGGNGSSVLQRASKVWGSVLSSRHYSPKTGVHRWAVKLDKCERGHVFIGVATTQASMRTYVGGDKYGWGMIGTQALWHDRRKIRGDYGATFRTGSTIIVTLDTDAGTLSFSAWKDTNTSSSESLVQNILSPRRQGHVGGTIEDWGVAFEGLPLDSRLYPAVGLYQRDDRVTLLTVEQSSRVSSRIASLSGVGGECYFPRPGASEQTLVASEEKAARVRRFNDLLTWQAVQYVADTLHCVVESLQSDDDFALSTLIPSLAASLCLAPPSVPVLSTRFALDLLPHLSRCVCELERLRDKHQTAHKLFATGLNEGKWVIRATGSSGSGGEFEEYVVDFTNTSDSEGSLLGFEGRGVGTTGKSKNGLVAMFGAVEGSSVHFVEEWSDGTDEGSRPSINDDASSCVVAARLSLDGNRFEGVYRNVHFGTSGHIVGMRPEESTSSKIPLNDPPSSLKQNTESAAVQATAQAILCLAHSHLATIVGEDAASDIVHQIKPPTNSSMSPSELAVRHETLKSLFSRPLLSTGSLCLNNGSLEQDIDYLKKLYCPPIASKALQGIEVSCLLDQALRGEGGPIDAEPTTLPAESEIFEQISAVDGKISHLCGGEGSLSVLCPSEYSSSRKRVLHALLYHSRMMDKVSSDSVNKAIPSMELEPFWRASLRVMEDGIRSALSKSQDQSKRQVASNVCQLHDRISDFLLDLERPSHCVLTVQEASEEFVWFYRALESEYDLEYLRSEMSCASKRGLLRLIALQDVVALLSDKVDSTAAIESLVVGLPRLLGRGQGDTATNLLKYAESKSGDGVPDLDGNYLAGLSGSSSWIRGALRGNIRALFRILGRVMDRTVSRQSDNESVECRVSADSLVLSILAVFVGNIRKDDLDDVIVESDILTILPKIFKTHRSAVLDDLAEVKDDEEAFVVKKLQAVCQRDLSRAILRCSTAAAHVIIYQAVSNGSLRPKDRQTTSLCLGMLIGELAVIFPFLEHATGTSIACTVPKQANEDWERWYESCHTKSKSASTAQKKFTGEQIGSSGIQYLREHGTTLNVVVQATSPKQSSRQKGAASAQRSPSDNSTKGKAGFSNYYLTHWLHALCSVLQPSGSLAIINTDSRWLHILLKVIGLSVDQSDVGSVNSVNLRSRDGRFLPARFRARILRLILPLLTSLAPSQPILEGLFSLAGAGVALVTRSIDEEESLVSREAVSLLRHLHSPTRQNWRASVNTSIAACVSSDASKISGFYKKMGVLSFFSGSLEAVGRGSYVLLKPAAAVPLSPEHLSAASSKSNSSAIGGGAPSATAGGAPLHVVGNGTESVVAGLCRSEASAGIVSSIDMKNGICEVILLSRYQEDSEVQSSVLETPNRANSGSSGGRSSGGRHVLTVRALRTPLSDVVHAQEVPLHLDDTIPVDKLVGSMLWSSVDSLLSAVVPGGTDKPEASEVTESEANASAEASDGGPAETTPTGSDKSLRSGVLSLSSDLMTVRCCMVVLSDKKILSTVLDDGAFKGRLSKLLSLAWPEGTESEGLSNFVQSARSKFLSSLPTHEARYGHLVSLMRDVGLRIQILDQTSETEWDNRLKKDATVHEGDETSGEPEGTNVQASGLTSLSASPSTPPVLAGSFVGRTRSETTTAGRDTDSHSNRSISQSTGGSNSEDDDESEAASTAASHLREAAIAQMAELGLPRSWSELALRRTGTNIEAAVHFCLERGGEMERLIAEEQERDRMMQRDSASGASRRRVSSEAGATNHLRRQLLEMGFPSRWCTEALAATGNNVDEALTWILTNGERLSEEDEAMEADEDDENDGDEDDNDSLEDDDDDEDETEDGEGALPRTEELAPAEKEEDDGSDDRHPPSTEQGTLGWSGSIVPLRFISGRSTINAKTMEITGLPTGGFSSVGTKGILLTSGKWYYEAILETAGCLQIGWADGSFAGHCHADRGDGCGDGPSSWAFDGWRRYRWHSTATEWGCRWREGDVVGCLVDMDEHIISFTLNGEGESIGMGRAFSGEGFRPCGGVYACVSFNRREKLRLILGGSGSEPFKNQPPPGYHGVGEAVLEAVAERSMLLEKENVLGCATESIDDSSKRFLCDFSDGEHGHELMAWAHRYYGSDASVHLGSGRLKQTAGVPKGSPVTSSVDAASSYVTRRVEKAWSTEEMSSSKDSLKREQVMSAMKSGLESVQMELAIELFNECIVMAILLSRKLVLHLMMTLGKDFDAGIFAGTGSELGDMRRFWNVIEACGSLRNAGWVGEAGTMAVAAEALGLGISSNDQLQSRHSSERSGVVSAADLDDGLYLAVGGISQVLSAALGANRVAGAGVTSTLFAASAEAAIGGDAGGGVLAFLKESLQSGVSTSEPFRKILVAAVRRSVRQLAVVEYDGDDSDAADGQEEDEDLERISNALGRQSGAKGTKAEDGQRQDSLSQPDARLTCFFSGLLLSHPVQTASEDFEEIEAELFGAWSIGLLSASLPWRMICAFTAAGILNQNPHVFSKALQLSPTLSRFYGRLQSTVARRVWAERAAVPVCSRYVQSLVELLAGVKRSVALGPDLPREFSRSWGTYNVDAATPVPFKSVLEDPSHSSESFWESEDGWVSSDSGWEVYSGTVEYKAVDWKTPSRSAVRTLMDGGEGPPMLREGCIVMRGPDWDDSGSGTNGPNEDGRDLYEDEKAKREKDKRLSEDEDTEKTPAAQEPDGHSDVKPEDVNSSEVTDPADEIQSENPAEPSEAPKPETRREEESSGIKSVEAPKKKKKKIPSPKLPMGTVLSIEPWKGIPALGRRVRWHLTGIEGIYRYGGDGGRYDVNHVETNEKQTRVKKRHPIPESAEQCAARHGFGVQKSYSVLLRLRRSGEKDVVDGQVVHRREGVLEWPDFGAGVRASCTFYEDGSVTLVEKEVLFGSKDSGWEARFGQPSFVSGSVILLEPVGIESLSSQAELDIKSSCLSQYEELCGTTTFDVVALRNRDGGSKIQVTSVIRLFSGKRPSDGGGPQSTQPLLPQPIRFDDDYHASSLSLSRDGKTVSCVASDGRGTAFGSTGFTKGVHYWEVKLEQADIGSVFIGVAEKPNGSGSGSSFGHDTPPRLNRWHGWGFVNFRATYTSGAERVYGAHCHAGDTVGVLLDCDAGRVSFFFDGLKYGEHILNDLGCAFENLSPFGFNVDGCGSGGASQGAPSGFEGGRGGRYPAQGTVRPRALWPVIGLRNQGDRVTFSSKWSTSYGVDGVTTVDNILAVDQILSTYANHGSLETKVGSCAFPSWFVREAFTEFKRWSSGQWSRSATRGSGPYRLACFGLDVDMDASPRACAAASAGIGLKYALLAGDRVRLTRSAGRILELAEEAVVVGAYQGRLYYRIVSQKSEGGSLTEGGGRAWCWDESEVVDGLPFVSPGKGLDVALPMLNRFSCLSPGGLRIVYEGGAVLRSDLEIFDGSANLGTIPVSAIIPRIDVLERRVNSCGVVRYRIRYEEVGEGWISARIRGGKEDPIIETVKSTADDSETEDTEEATFRTPLDCASVWLDRWQKEAPGSGQIEELDIDDLETFEKLVASAIVPGYTIAESDSLLSAAVSAISNYSEGGEALECPFSEVAAALSFALGSNNGEGILQISDANPMAIQAAATVFAGVNTQLPALKPTLARVAFIRAFNRRARLALPWLSIRPSQEGSAILGGLCGYGTSTDRAGRSLLTEAQETWVQVPSIATRIRSLRNLFFTSVKRGLLQSITEATTTPTPLSHDEYELPREIRTVRINRLKAARAMSSEDLSAKRKYSVFAQLHNETKSWGGAALRRGYVAKGHGGQKRAFKVKLIGEGVNDYSGPYREAFTDALSEVTKTDDKGRGVLGVFDPTPNNASEIGENRDLHMFSLNGRDLSLSGSATSLVATVMDEEGRLREYFASLMADRDEASREVEEALVFLGRITGAAYRHGIPVDLPLPMQAVWKALVEQESSRADRLREIDHLAYRQVEDKRDPSPLLWWQQRMLNSFVEGLSNVLPVEVLPIFSGEELRDIFCGNPDVDVDLLKSVVEYEGYQETDDVIEFFWETLREITNDERKSFLQFVWARNRLPMREADFEAPFKIQKDSINTGDRANQALPSASTCFFSLTLPEYTSQKTLKDKLLFAISNVTTMETDFQTNSAEISEGYRAF